MWDYAEAGRLLTMRSVRADKCIFCPQKLIRKPAKRWDKDGKTLLAQLSICACCGWWSVYRVIQGKYPRTAGYIESYSGSIGCLKELDLQDISSPLSEVRQYLLARKESIYSAHPQLFEDVVCSVFRDFGWKARVTAYSGDDGIDVILDGPSQETIGVQVKRYRKDRRIEAEQIRSLAGALVLNGHTRGVFVTTSGFTAGARTTARRYAAIGLPIKLVDVKRFLESVGVAQIRSFKLDGKRFARYILSTAHHLGSGTHEEFVPGEDLRKRTIVIQTLTRNEFSSIE